MKYKIEFKTKNFMFVTLFSSNIISNKYTCVFIYLLIFVKNVFTVTISIRIKPSKISTNDKILMPMNRPSVPPRLAIIYRCFYILGCFYLM